MRKVQTSTAALILLLMLCPLLSGDSGGGASDGDGELLEVEIFSEPICLGVGVSFHGVTNEVEWQDFDWDIECMHEGQPVGIEYFDDVYDDWATKFFSQPGTFRLTATAIYSQHQSSISGTISPGLPTFDEVDAGLDVESDPDCVTVWFAIRCLAAGGTLPLVGPYVDGGVQERIRRPQYNPPFDSGWMGPKENEFYIDSGYIVDVKCVTDPTGQSLPWGSPQLPPPGTVFDDFYQQNRIVLTECHEDPLWGDPLIIYFPERHFQRVMVGSGNSSAWKLVEVAN